MNLSIKPLITASLFSLSIAYCQNDQMTLNESYSNRQTCNPPTGVCVKGSKNVFITGSFIYWIPYQENMELGIVSVDPTTTFVFGLDGDVVNLDFKYKPGFKVGLGMNLTRDNWDLYSQYTWFRGNHRTTVSLDPAGNELLFPKWQIPDSPSPRYLNGREDWRLHMDLFDLELGKDYCISTSLSFRTFFGARAAWIRQRVDVDYLNDTTGNLSRNVFITQKSHSWALGPRIGLQTNWMLGKGVRIYGNGSGDILFTRYTTLSFDQQGITSTGAFATSSQFKLRQNDVNQLRSHCELEFGFGWGTYFNSKHNCHIDLSAGYNFQIFFDQNMFRLFVDDQQLASSFMPISNLFTHGLTTMLRLDF